MGQLWAHKWIFLAVVVIFMMTSGSAYGGAWTLPKGQSQIISTFSQSQADTAYLDDTHPEIDVRFNKSEQRLYWEYGARPKLTLVASGGFQKIDFSVDGRMQRYDGLATTKIGARWALADRGNWKLAVQPSVVIPDGGEIIPDADLGSGGIGAEFRGLAGLGFTAAGRPAFIDIQAGAEFRTKDAPQQVFMDATMGIRPVPKIQILGQAFFRKTGGARYEQDVILPNDSLKVQGSLVYDLRPKISVQLGVQSTLTGRNIVKEKGVFIGLWQRF